MTGKPGADRVHARMAFLRDALRPARKTRIVDVGASPLTLPPYARLLRSGGCEVWGFEPMPVAYDALQSVAEGRDQHYLPHAVGDGGPGMLKICKSAGFSSLLEPNTDVVPFLGRFDHAMTVTETLPVETVRLDDIDALPDFDLLKIDIQGGECAVFEGAGRRLAQAVAVITEVAAIPLYRDQPLLDTQMRQLRMSGYDLHKFLFFKQMKLKRPGTVRMTGARHGSQLVDGDAVFVRGLLEMDRLGTETLKHLAILADAVFESFDLSVAVLEVLMGRGVISADTIVGYVDLVPETGPLAEAEPEENEA